jgi:hypothetical protein
MSGKQMIETFESRLLMSATPVLFDSAVKEARLVVRAELLKFRSDLALTSANLIGDLSLIKSNKVAGDTSLKAAFTQLRTDTKAQGTQLKIDRLTEAANALADESTIKLDIVQIIKDRKDATALAADKTKLQNDRITLQNDLVAGLDSRIATRQSFEQTLSDDANAISTAAANDTGATQALKDAAAKFATDKTSRLNTLETDLNAIVTARNSLVTALNAAQSS